MEKYNPKFLKRTIELATNNVDKGGGPFGAVIVKNGTIISEGVNCVTTCNDPTSHAEIVAIRNACQKLNTYNLEGCELYSSCEPCPMCLSAIYWARISKLYYAADSKSASNAGFDDEFIYKELSLPYNERKLKTTYKPLKEGEIPFKKWIESDNKTEY